MTMWQRGPAVQKAALMIKHEGSKWVLYTSDGSRKLGTHDSKEDAERQEEAIKANEARGSKLGHTV